MIERFWALGVRGLWMLLVVLLPITSLPLLVRLVGSETVAAPSGLALLAFSVLWLIPQLVKGIALPRPVVPILGLFFVATLSSILSLWLPLPAYKGIPAVQNTLSAVLTLAVGVCFYLAASTYPSSDERLSWTFRLLNWSGLVVILWSFAQMVGWHAARYPMWMREIHGLYSVGPLFRDRVTGFALEPSWLANQLNLMYLPFWLSASVRRFSVHKMLPGGISLENILLAGGVTVLLLTLSRVGMLAFLLMAGYLLLRLNQLAVRRVHQIALNRWNNPAFHQALKKWLVYIGIVLLLFVFYAVVIFGAGYGLSKIDPRMKEVFSFSWEDSNPLLKYANRLTFAARLVYWEAGWGVFREYPWLGVGLGNAGYFFPQTLSDYSWRLMEVRDLVFRSSSLLNIKSLWVRLLAETGIVGFAFFSAWLYVVWQSGRFLMASAHQLSRVMGLMAHLVIIGLMIEGFSLDTFALPNYWLPLGLVTATVVLEYRRLAEPNGSGAVR